MEIHFPSGRHFHSEAFTLREPPPSRKTGDSGEKPTVAPSISVASKSRLGLRSSFSSPIWTGSRWAPGLYTPRVRVGVLPPIEGPGRERLRLPETALAGAVVRGEEPVAESRIGLVSAEDGLVWGSTRTDADGRFTIPFVAPGTYLVQVDDRLTRTVVLGCDEHRELGELQVP